jgi:hypothetical protein
MVAQPRAAGKSIALAFLVSVPKIQSGGKLGQSRVI